MLERSFAGEGGDVACFDNFVFGPLDGFDGKEHEVATREDFDIRDISDEGVVFEAKGDIGEFPFL